LDALTSQTGALLRFGSCGALGEGLAPGQLEAHLERKGGPVSGVVCEAAASGMVAELESQLRAAGRPFVIIYAGQPEKVTSGFRVRRESRGVGDQMIFGDSKDIMIFGRAPVVSKKPRGGGA